MERKFMFNPIDYLCVLLKATLVGMMIAIATLTFYQVVMRYGFNKSSSWTEEAIRFIFIWCSFLAVAVGVREKIHIGINIIVELLDIRVRFFLELIGWIAIMCFASYLAYYGWKVVVTTNFQTSPGLGVKMSWVYSSVPTMGVLIMLFCLEGAVKSILDFLYSRKEL